MFSYDAENIRKYTVEEASKYVSHLMEMSYDEWFKYLFDNYGCVEVTSITIPQFSNFEDGTTRVVSILRKLGDYGPEYEKIGRYLLEKGKKSHAYFKYGENHAKFSEQLGLLRTKKKGRKYNVFLSEVGKIFDGLSENEKEEFINKQILTIPIIHRLTYSNVEINIMDELKKYLSESTSKRRHSNVKKIMDRVRSAYGTETRIDQYPNLKKVI